MLPYVQGITELVKHILKHYDIATVVRPHTNLIKKYQYIQKIKWKTEVTLTVYTKSHARPPTCLTSVKKDDHLV